MNKRKLAEKIMSGELKNKFFDKNLQKILDLELGDNLKIQNLISSFLEFSDTRKEEIWYLTYEKECFSFKELYSLLKENRYFLKGFSKNKFEKFLTRFEMIPPELINREELHNFQESINWFISLDKKYPLFLGWLETESEILLFSNSFVEKQIEEVTKRKNDEFCKNIVVPLKLESLGKEAYELTSKKMLEDESLLMNNCVRGYFKKIERNESRIFHVEKNGIKATVEIVNNYGIKIFQLKGINNEEIIDDEVKYIANEIRREIELKFSNLIKENEWMKRVEDLFSGRSSEPIFLDILSLASTPQRIREITSFCRPILLNRLPDVDLEVSITTKKYNRKRNLFL